MGWMDGMDGSPGGPRYRAPTVLKIKWHVSNLSLSYSQSLIVVNCIVQRCLIDGETFVLALRNQNSELRTHRCVLPNGGYVKFKMLNNVRLSGEHLSKQDSNHPLPHQLT